MVRIIWGLPFSHYCRRIERLHDCLEMPYERVDLTLFQMVKFAKLTRQGTVPVVLENEEVWDDSAVYWTYMADMDWFTASQEERRFIHFCEEEVGPMVRRTCYRTAYAHPFKQRTPLPLGLLAIVGRPVILNILKLYKARRHEEADAKLLWEAIDQAEAFLKDRQQIGAVDALTAPLFEPLLYVDRCIPGLEKRLEESGIRDWVESVNDFPRMLTRKRRWNNRDYRRIPEVMRAPST